MSRADPVAGAEQLLPEAALPIGGLVDTTVLQFRHDEIDEVDQVLRLARTLQVEAIDVGLLHPRDELVGNLARRADDEALASGLRPEAAVVLQALQRLFFLQEIFGDRTDSPRLLASVRKSGEIL